MKFGVFLTLAGAAVLTGCGSSGAQNATPSATKPADSPTATAKTVSVVKPTPTPHSVPVTGSPTVSSPTGSAPTPSPTILTQPTAVPFKTQHVTVAQNAGPYQRASALLRGGQYTTAITEFDTAIHQKQHVADAYFGQGTAYLALQKYSQAFKDYKQAVAASPKNPAYVYYAAYAALYARSYHEALKFASRYVAVAPRDARGYHLRFLTYGQLLDASKQLADARSVVRLQPRTADSYNDLGIALTNVGLAHTTVARFRDAVGAFSKAIQLSPTMSAYYINRAQAEVHYAKSTQVLSDLEKAKSYARDATTRQNVQQAITHYRSSIHH